MTNLTSNIPRSFEIGVAARHIEGQRIGDRNHSRSFPPFAIDALYDVLLGKLRLAVGDVGTLMVTKPFFISADKDRTNQRLVSAVNPVSESRDPAITWRL